MDVLTQMKKIIIEQEAEKATHLVHMNTAKRAGWVLADHTFVSHVQEGYPLDVIGTAVRKHAIVCGFAHEATGRMWVTTVYYRTETIDNATRTQVYSDDETCADPKLQAWVNLYSALSCI